MGYFPKAIFAFGALLLGTAAVLLSAIKARPEETPTLDDNFDVDDDGTRPSLIFREDRDG